MAQLTGPEIGLVQCSSVGSIVHIWLLQFSIDGKSPKISAIASFPIFRQLSRSCWSFENSHLFRISQFLQWLKSTNCTIAFAVVIIA